MQQQQPGSAIPPTGSMQATMPNLAPNPSLGMPGNSRGVPPGELQMDSMPPPGMMGGPPGGEMDNPMDFLPPVSPVKHTMMLAFGMTFRYAVACGVWTGVRFLWWHVKKAASGEQKESPSERNRRLRRDLVMWAHTFGMDLLASTLLTPTRAMASRNTARLLTDFAFPTAGHCLSFLDGFSPVHFLAYGLRAYEPFNEKTSDWWFFIWNLPIALLSIGKLVHRRRRHGKENTKTIRCGLALAVQFVFRGALGVVTPTLPMSPQELVASGVVVLVDKYLEAYLARNTYPWPAELEEAAQVDCVDSDDYKRAEAV